MEVVTLSSDSEASNHDINVNDTSLPGAANWFDEVYTVDWEADDARPCISYDSTSPEKPGSNRGEEIEDFITPAKQNERNTIKAINNCRYTNTLKPHDADILSCNSNPLNKSPKSKIQSSRPKLTPEKREQVKTLKKQTVLEKEKSREEKKAEQIRQKALKAAYSENRRNLKPEENIKFFKVNIDIEIINAPYGGNIISLLQQNNIQYAVESQIKSHTISWSKRKVEKVVDNSGCLTEKVDNKEENQLLYVLDWGKAVELIHNNELLSQVEIVKSVHIDKKITLIIYGLEKYFKWKKSKKSYGVNEKKKPKGREEERLYEDAPFITRDQLEFALIDLQVLGKHNSRLIETPEEFAALVHNFTKSLAQVDFKLDKQSRQDDLGWFAPDSNQSVKVDKNGNGLLRLWQQQICQFNAVGLETAQAIISHYNSPLALMNHYKSCGGVEEGELLLQNIQIRRDAGILSTTRRVGPQLSRKIYRFFTSDDPDLEL